MNRLDAWVGDFRIGLLFPHRRQIIQGLARLLSIADLVFRQFEIRQTRLKRFDHQVACGGFARRRKVIGSRRVRMKLLRHAILNVRANILYNGIDMLRIAFFAEVIYNRQLILNKVIRNIFDFEKRPGDGDNGHWSLNV